MSKQVKMSMSDELQLVEREYGNLSPANVVEWGRANTKSQIHKSIEWDDSKAGDLYRLEQARGIIRVSVRIIEVKHDPIKIGVRMVENKPTPCPVRSHFPLERSADGNTVYHPIEDIMADEGKRKMLLATAMGELAGFKRKYMVLSELSQVFQAIDKMLEKMTKGA